VGSEMRIRDIPRFLPVEEKSGMPVLCSRRSCFYKGLKGKDQSPLASCLFWAFSCLPWRETFGPHRFCITDITMKLTDNTGTWNSCESEAVLKGGHLVTINDAAEQSWLQDSLPRAIFGSVSPTKLQREHGNGSQAKRLPTRTGLVGSPTMPMVKIMPL